MGSKIPLSGEPYGVGIDSSGMAYVTMMNNRTVARFRIDAPTPMPLPIAVGELPQDIVLNRAGTTAYVGNYDKVTVIDAASGTVKSIIPIEGAILRLALSSDESRLYVASTSFWMVPTAGGAPVSATLSGTYGIAPAPSGNAVYVASVTGRIWRLDPATLAVQTTAVVTGPFLWDLTVSPDGKEVYVEQEAGGFFALDGTTLATIVGMDLKATPVGMTITPDGTQLYVASADSGTVRVIDRATRTVVKTITVGGTPQRIAFDRLGTVALVTNRDGWVDVIR